MSYKLLEQEIKAVINLPAQKRYSYFIKKIVDSEEVWSLVDSQGWCLFSDSENNEVFPIWSDAKYASFCVNEYWGESNPKKISLNDFLDKWISGLQKDKRLIGIFPLCNSSNLADKGVVVSPERLYQDISEELEKY
ncbi:MAG: DUF2750 domain-containing protein [Epsilonproteobacteria bacterium]|nr:DUF2750 domain-containing protein [Campylobacterota bacterium]